MSGKDSSEKHLTQQEIDQIVATQADDDSAWERPAIVTRSKPASVSIPATLAARAAFLARLHHKASVEEWLTRVIEERVELEEAAFASAKHDHVQHSG